MKKSKLNKCMKTISEYCHQNEDRTFSGDALSLFCQNNTNLQCLELLEATDNVHCFYVDGCNTPVSITLNNKGVLYFQIQYEKRIAAIKGFFFGCISGIISTIILPLILSFFTKLLF